MKNVLGMLKGKGRFETIENYSILLIAIGTTMLTIGIGLTVVSTQGIPTLLTMLGGLISFLATVFLIFVWLSKENLTISIIFGSFLISVPLAIMAIGTISLIALGVAIVLAIVFSGILIGLFFLLTKRLPW